MVAAPRAFVVASILLVSSACAARCHAADTKMYGFPSKHAGKGIKLLDPDLVRVNKALDSLSGKTFTTKAGTYSGAAIVADLRAAIADGRLGRGHGAAFDKNGATQPDGTGSPAGARVNISDHQLTGATTRSLARTLAHEWLHMSETTGSEAALEAPAYQLGKAVLVALGGTSNDPAWVTDSTKEVEHKKTLNGESTTLPGSNTQSGGARQGGGTTRKNIIVIPGQSRVTLTRDGEFHDDANPLTKHMFLAVRVLAMPGPDRALVFGADTTSPANPQGWLTVLDADTTHFFNRQDLPLAGTRHPSSVDYDPATRRWFVLDTHLAGSGITIWRDTNGDSIPDLRAPAAFASAAFPGVSTARGLMLATHPGFGAGVVLTTYDPDDVDARAFADPVRFLVDFNSDGVADQSIPMTEDDFEDFPPTIAEIPLAGATDLDVCGEGGHTIQLWKTDATADARDELLGSVVTSPTGVATASLARALAAGERLVAVDATLSWQLAGPEVVVGPAPLGPAPWVAALLMAVSGATVLRRRRRSGVPTR